MAGLIDTHAHLTEKDLDRDLPDVLARARGAGVEGIIAVGITADSSERSVALADSHPMLRATVGVHPNSIPAAAPGDWDRILTLIDRPGVVGIGETGLDRYWDTTPFPQQEEWFARHLELCRQRDLAVVIHCREAEPDVVRMLRTEFDRHGPIRAVLHSFVGSQETADALLAMGLYLSFAGMLTYKNASSVREVAARVPKDRLLVETDCPYLSPEPMRGKRNEPANVAHTAKHLAELHGLPLADLAALTTANARRLFGITV